MHYRQGVLQDAWHRTTEFDLHRGSGTCYWVVDGPVQASRLDRQGRIWVGEGGWRWRDVAKRLSGLIRDRLYQVGGGKGIVCYVLYIDVTMWYPAAVSMQFEMILVSQPKKILMQCRLNYLLTHNAPINEQT